MKLVTDTLHGLGWRPHYEPAELDREFERLVSTHKKARSRGGDEPLTTDDLTVLIEEHVDELDVYADLTRFGPGVEGVTLFVAGRRPSVLISNDLGESSARENRLRTTLAHELGHVRLHSYIIDLAVEAGRLDRRGSAISCKRETMVSAPRVDWREWQASYASGAILMPASKMRNFVDAWRPRSSSPQEARSELERAIADRFLVSTLAARVRLQVLGLYP